MARAYVGTSGWSYDHWRNGVFYPPRLASDKWLAYLAERFDTVELNASFYRWPKPGSVAKWAQTGPDTFRFAVKLWRGFTHYNRLEDPKDRLADFLHLFDSLPAHKRGPLLLQLPPQMEVDAQRLDRFLAKLEPFRWPTAVEFRNPSWLETGIVRILNDRGVALCVHDMQRQAQVRVPNDVPFVYVRRHGPGSSKYSGSYDDTHLAADAAAIRAWVEGGRDVYVYYNNDRKGNAVRNAARLREMLGLPGPAQPAVRETEVKVVHGPTRPVRAHQPTRRPRAAQATAPRKRGRQVRRTLLTRPHARAAARATRTTVETERRRGRTKVRRTVKVSEPRLR